MDLQPARACKEFLDFKEFLEVWGCRMDPKSDLLLQTTGCTWLRPISMFLGVPLDQVRTLVKFSEFVEKLCLRRMRFVYLVYLVLGEFGTV